MALLDSHNFLGSMLDNHRLHCPRNVRACDPHYKGAEIEEIDGRREVVRSE